MHDKLERLSERLDEIDGLLGGEHAARDMDSYRKLTRERAEILPIVELFLAYRSASADFSGAAEMLADPELKELAIAEQESASADMARLEVEMQRALLPKDPNDDKNLFLEIRAGTGGDESALFAADLFRM
ncbi:MAG: PCRF domain-containing protein, partial [Polynucleobacter sp.]|nr:PCRF domain-containing protein [Polynucleobacter sp.]